jgi:hypothetical protein
MAERLGSRTFRPVRMVALAAVLASQGGGRVGAVGLPQEGAPAKQDFKRVGSRSEIVHPLPSTFPAGVRQAASQADPTPAGPVDFEVLFGAPIHPPSFDPSDVVQIGTATVGAWLISDGDGDGQTFELQATGVGNGTVIPTIPAGAVGTPGACSASSATPGAPCAADADCPPGIGAGACAGSRSNLASTSADNSVTVGAVGCTTLTYLYVAGWSPAVIYIYCVENDGTLTLIGDRPGAGDVRDLEVGLQAQRLYYASADLTSFIVSSDGSLAEAGTLAVGGGAFDDLALDGAGHYLYGTHSAGGGRLNVYDTQSVSNVPAAIQVLSGLIAPLGVSLSATGDHVFVANQWSFLGDPETAEETVVLVRNANGTVTQAGNTDWHARPDHFAVHPSLPFVYHTERSGGRVTASQLVGDELAFTGSLFSGHGATQLAIDAAGTRLYVVNHNDDSTAVFAVDGAGSLSLLQVVPSGDRPQHLVLHPDGGFLYVAGTGGAAGPSEIIVFAIAPDGTLSPIQTEAIPDPGAYRLAIFDPS